MTITTPSPASVSGSRSGNKRMLRSRTRGMTLPEILIATTLGAILLIAVTSALLFVARTHINLANYGEMEVAARRGLEQFAQDTRQASDITWNNAEQVTMVVDTVAVVYGFDRDSRVFFRTVGGQRRDLIAGVSRFNFTGFAITGVALPIETAAERLNANLMTKQLQISLNCIRQANLVAQATNTVVSGRYVLRNKRVTS